MNTIIIDIDGICLDPTARLERCKDTKGVIDWERVFSNEEVSQDPPIEGAFEALGEIDEESSYHFIFITGRSDKCRDATENALLDSDDPIYACPWARIFMRKDGDTRPDYEIKKEFIEAYKIIFREDFIAAIDDDWSGNLKRMYESLGIPMFYSFDEFFQSDWWDKEERLKSDIQHSEESRSIIRKQIMIEKRSRKGHQ